MKRISFDLSMLQGAARKVVSCEIQREFFARGFYWCFDKKLPQYTDQPFINISLDKPKVFLTYGSGDGSWRDDYTSFRASIEIEKAFEYLDRPEVVNQTIDGLKVEIKSDSIKINASELVAQVEQKAKAIQQKTFGTK